MADDAGRFLTGKRTGRMRRRFVLEAAALLFAVAWLLTGSGCVTDQLLRKELAESEAARGALLSSEGRYREAYTAWHRAAELEGDTLLYRYEAGRTALLAGKVTEGIGYAEGLFRDYPDNLLVQELLAYGRLKQGHRSEAIDLYRTIADADRLYASGHLNLVRLLKEEEKYVEAYAVLSRFMESAEMEEAGEIKKVLTRRRFIELADLAELAEGIEDPSGMEAGKEPEYRKNPAEYLRKALTLPALDPVEDGQAITDSAEIQLRLARIMEKEGAWQQAADYYRKVIEERAGKTPREGPDQTPELLFSFARLLIAELEQYPEGLEMLDHALQSGFSDTGALEKLTSRPDLLDREAVIEVVVRHFPDL